MKSISAAYDAFLAGECLTETTLWLVTRTDGVIFAATSHDADILFEGVTYLANSGYTATDVETMADLNVDNMEVQGFSHLNLIDGPSITFDDVRAGLWDFANVRIFRVNYADLTMGSISERSGKLGEISLDRGQFKAELRGKMQAFTRVIGRMDAPSCNANFGDARCKFDTASVTVTGVLSGANGATLYDVGRREPGPVGGVAVTGITNANPGVITFDAGLSLFNGETVTLAGIVGPTSLNAITVVRNATATSFELSVDTTDTVDYPPYVSGGTVTPAGSTGYFDFGLITFLSGLNAGLSMEVKSYFPGQITLQLPMPYPSAAGDMYRMVAGCDKSLPTCRDRFNNVVNFRGFPYLPGTDKIVQVGRHDASSGGTSTGGGGSSGGGGGGTGGTSGGSTGGGGGSGAGGGGIGTGGGSNGGGTIDPGGGGTVAPGDTLQDVSAQLLNLPPVGSHGNNSSFYISTSGVTDNKLSGFAVYKSIDGGTTYPLYTTFGPLQVNRMGVTSTALGDGVIGDTQDTTNTVTVVMDPAGDGTLVSDATAHSYANYKNLILIGNELIQFNTATPAGTRTYVLSDLWRGCYGTEYALTGHGSGETVVFINAYNDGYFIDSGGHILYEGLVEVWDPLSPIGTVNYDELGKTYVYKVVPAGKHLADVSPVTFTNTGESMRPICPYAVAGSRASGNITIAWEQRFWLNGGWVTSLAGTIPTGWNANFATTHTVNIYADNTYATIKRTLTASGNTNNVVYSAAQQTTDFGAPQVTVYVDIIETWTYQPASGPLLFSSHPIRRAL